MEVICPRRGRREMCDGPHGAHAAESGKGRVPDRIGRKHDGLAPGPDIVAACRMSFCGSHALKFARSGLLSFPLLPRCRPPPS